MALYLLDYNGTLNTLDDPAAFIRDLKKQDPTCSVVIVSGEIPPEGPLKAADGFWMKPFTLRDFNPDRVVYVDDDEALLRVIKKQIQRLGITDVTLLAPEGLLPLLNG